MRFLVFVEDLHPVSEVEAGVNIRQTGGVRRQVAGSLPGRQPGTGTRRARLLSIWCVSFLDALGLTLGGRAATVVGVHPAWLCSPFQGVLLGGSGAGVGDCRGGAVFQNAVLFFYPRFFFGGDNPFYFSGDMGYLVHFLLDMPVSKRVPTPCCHDAYSVGTPRWACRE